LWNGVTCETPGGDAPGIGLNYFADLKPGEVNIEGHFMNAEVAAFLDSLKSGAPPAVAAPLLRAVWHGLRGEWEAAHQIAQDDTSAEGAWVHAWLHRIEGDLANARYWYRQAHRQVAEGDLREEGETIAAFLLQR
jgi:hypothetical protein